MVRIVQDIDRGLGECGTIVEHNDADGTRVIGNARCPRATTAPSTMMPPGPGLRSMFCLLAALSRSPTGRG